MGSDEYLEGVVKDAFKPELEVDESVTRSLPFFAATLALAATLYGYAANGLPALSWRPMSVVLHVLLALGAACFLGVIVALFRAVRARQYRIPPRETELTAWRGNLIEHFTGRGLTPRTIDQRVLVAMRERMIFDYSAAAEHNWAANKSRVGARAVGMTLAVVMLGIAFTMIATMFAIERVSSAIREGAPYVTSG